MEQQQQQQQGLVVPVRRCGWFTRLTAEQLVFIFEYLPWRQFHLVLPTLNRPFNKWVVDHRQVMWELALEHHDPNIPGPPQ